jgi:hypothetical protein
MVDPQRGDRGRKEQQRDNETLGRLGLLAAKDQKRQAGDERGEDKHFDRASALKAVKQFVASPATPRFL